MITLQEVSLRAGGFRLDNISVKIATATYAVLMGGTGQGKSTILEAICGLRSVASGRIWLGDRDVTDLAPGDRSIGYVPQDLALFPTMTVREHLEFALRIRHASVAMRRQRVDELAPLLGISGLLDRLPRGLSGGEAQRVALGRALSFEPKVLILDEPLNALDETTRDRMCELLRRVQKKVGVTTLHVTHSRVEARWLADRLYRLERGVLRESPVSELEETP